MPCICGNGCENCTTVCESCGEKCGNCCDEICPECRKCVDCSSASSFCDNCGVCSDCARVCSICGNICENCADLCPNCDSCLDCAGGEFCPDCGECENCGEHCENCGRCENCVDTICTESGDKCSECAVLCPECGKCEDCAESLCPNCGTCDECAEAVCLECGYCSDCTTLCTECGEYCADCVEVCPDCGVCVNCASLCSDCGRCEACCEANSESYGCTHGVCTESVEWLKHYCTMGEHCITELDGPYYNDDSHWYLCGEGCSVKIDEEEHKFGAGVITQPPTTESDGILTVSCTVCDYEKTEVIPKLTDGHTHEFTVVVVEPTCTAGGYTTHTCSCGFVYKDNITSPTGHKYEMRYTASNHWEECSACHDKKAASSHKFGAWETTKSATYTAPGEKSHKCMTCGYTETASIPQLKSDGQYIITVEDENGSVIDELLTVGKSHLVPTLPVLDSKSTGNRFDGWRNKADNTVVKKDDKLSGNITIYPVWQSCGEGKHTDNNNDCVCDVCGEKLTVLFNVAINGGFVVSGVTDGKAAAGSTVTIQANEYENSYFYTWIVDSDNIGSVSLNKKTLTFTMPYEDVSITAVFREYTEQDEEPAYPVFFVLKFNTNGGSKIANVSGIYNTDIDLTEFVPEKDGYVFAGWYSDKNLTHEVTSIRLKKDMTVYAGWIEEDESFDEDVWEEPQGIEDTDDETADDPFIDISEDDWFYDDVMYVYGEGLMLGTDEEIFSPYLSTTRGMIVTVLWRMEGEPEVEGSTFVDVDSDEWYAEAIAWAEANEIVYGYGNGEFGPDDTITREQLAAILYRYARYRGLEAVTLEENLEGFVDSDTISEYAVSAMNWAVGKRYINGVEDDVLNPRGEATRAQIAAVLHRFDEDNRII